MRRRHTRRGKRRSKRTRRGGGVIFDVSFMPDMYTILRVNGQHLTRTDVAHEPVCIFGSILTQCYVIVMYDNDAPSPARLHWMDVRFDAASGESVVPYQPPSPPSGKVHTYTVDLLSKPRGMIDWGATYDVVPHFLDKMEVAPDIRNDFNIDEFMLADGWNLEARQTFTCG